MPFLREFDLIIDTKNSFPHSSGIASSASGFGALALCLCTMESDLGLAPSSEPFHNRTSNFARLGSGSAARSIFGYAVEWGRSDFFELSKDAYAIEVESLHPIFKTYCDSVLLVESGVKEVSSSVGHSLLKKHPFSKARYKVAHENTGRLKHILSSGDLTDFVQIAEEEALMLHALMLSSNPPYILLKPATLSVIEKIKQFRADTAIPICFTLDAGANVHALYPNNEKKKVRSFLESEIAPYCTNGMIHDTVGKGPNPF